MKPHLDIELSPPDLHSAVIALPPLERAIAAGAAMDHYRAAIGMLAVLRRKAIRSMVDGGESVASVAAKLRVTRQQVHRLLSEDDPRPIFQVEPGPAGTWVVNDLSNGGATKFASRAAAVAQARRWATRAGGRAIARTVGGAAEELNTA